MEGIAAKMFVALGGGIVILPLVLRGLSLFSPLLYFTVATLLRSTFVPLSPLSPLFLCLLCSFVSSHHYQTK